MIPISLAIIVFVLVLGLANGHFHNRGMHYHTHTLFYSVFFFVAAILLLLATGNIRQMETGSSLLFMGSCAGVYVTFGFLWERTMGDITQYFTKDVPVNFPMLLTPSHRSCTTKIFEIFLQDTVAAVVIWSLFDLEYRYGTIVAVMMIISFILHMPSVRLHGSFFGMYFLVTGTVLIPIAVWLLSMSHGGFAGLYALHILMYLILYGYVALNAYSAKCAHVKKESLLL